LKYPINLSFKILAFAPQIFVKDADENLIFYVKQKLFKLKEAISVCSDEEQSNKVFTINADRIIDFSASYNFTDNSGNPKGSIKRKGLRSIWRAHYNISLASKETMTIREEKPFVKIMDGIFGEIPFLGLLSSYLFHPSFMITREDGTEVIRIKKQPAFFEGKFLVEKLSEITDSEEETILLSIMMMILLERSRG